jgi:anti-sigma factor RsiW
VTANQGSALDIACRQVVDVVTDYLEGTLDPQLAAALEHHLRDCPGCDNFVEQMRVTVRELRRLPIETISDQAKRDLVDAFRGFTGSDASS